MNAVRHLRSSAVAILALSVIAVLAACDDDDPTQPAVDPPTVATGGVLAFGERFATVSGMVDPRGSDAAFWFEYGLTPAYGDVTGELPAPATPAGARAVETRIEGLMPGTLYHYRLVARNAGGTTSGADATLLTLDPNQPPDTQVTAAGTDTLETTVRWHVFWAGTDPDGVVVRYEWRVADHGPDGAIDPPDTLGLPWAATVITDTVITWQDGLGSRTFFVRAVDDREARDPTPASISVEAAAR